MGLVQHLRNLYCFKARVEFPLCKPICSFSFNTNNCANLPEEQTSHLSVLHKRDNVTERVPAQPTVTPFDKLLCGHFALSFL